MKIKRNFYPGDEWLYFKIYGGIKTCDDLMCGKLYSLMNRLKRIGSIHQWFFIRYSDPDFHIRLRLRLVSVDFLGKVVCAVDKLLRPMCDNGVLHKFVIDTYCREIERYGENAMQLTEDLFCIDSECVCAVLRKISGTSPDYRWISAFVSVDGFLSALGLGVNEKLELASRLSASYRVEFGYNEHNGKQLNDMYRSRRNMIVKALHGADGAVTVVASYFERRNRLIMSKTCGKAASLNVASLVHMMMNRHFASRNRVNELLLYDFLKRFYRSEIARGETVKC